MFDNPRTIFRLVVISILLKTNFVVKSPIRHPRKKRISFPVKKVIINLSYSIKGVS